LASTLYLDVRPVDEFTGKILAPPGLSETAQRGGHIPCAANIPWSQAANEDGTYKSADALRQLYEGNGVDGCGEVISYCRVGERSALLAAPSIGGAADVG